MSGIPQPVIANLAEVRKALLMMCGEGEKYREEDVFGGLGGVCFGAYDGFLEPSPHPNTGENECFCACVRRGKFTEEGVGLC